ncbi:MAG: ribosome maturation factor RimP [Clostridia bacterium]|nr:ribosome maturation factor RimP [Clostridia bacterium]
MLNLKEWGKTSLFRFEGEMKTVEICEQLAAPVIARMGFELCDVEFQKEYGDWVLTFYIDREGGVTIDDCEAVSRALDPILDEADPIEQEYVLSVSSLGIDRPLKKDRDYERAMGKEMQVRLYAPLEKKKEWIGELIGFDAETFTIRTEKGEERTIMKKDCALIRPNIRFD